MNTRSGKRVVVMLHGMLGSHRIRSSAVINPNTYSNTLGGRLRSSAMMSTWRNYDHMSKIGPRHKISLVGEGL